MYHNLIIDTNNLFLKNFHGYIRGNDIKPLRLEKENNEIYSVVIKGCLSKLSVLEKQFFSINNKGIVYLLFDNPLSTITARKIISNGEYKSNREPNNLPKGFYNYLNMFMEILKIYKDSYRVVQLSSSEADDLVYPLLKRFTPSENNKFLCVSTDMDFARNIQENVHWYNYKKIYDKTEFIRKYNFNPIGKKVILYKTLHGDRVDNIRNVVPKLKKRHLYEILDKFETVDELFKNFNKLSFSVELIEHIKSCETGLRINERLVDFVPIECDIEDVIQDCFEDIVMLKWYFKKLNMKLEDRMLDENETIYGYIKNNS